MKKQIVRLCVGIGAGLALMGSARPAKADCYTLYYNGAGLGYSCGGTQHTWTPCIHNLVTFNLSLFNTCFNACIDSACAGGSMSSCMLNNGSPWSCGTCP